MILDVGCGYKPRGDVNLDRLRKPYEAPGPQQLQCPLNVQGIGEYLPFKDRSFDEVISDQVLEHSSIPEQFVQECIRVAKKRVTIICPHKYSSVDKLIYHHNHFDAQWFNRWNPQIYYEYEPLFPFFNRLNRFMRWGIRHHWPFKRPRNIIVILKVISTTYSQLINEHD